MAIYSFGSGVLLGQRTDVAGATPVNFGLVQEVQLDLQFTTKELYGQYQFPLAIARGQAKAQAKAKMAQVSGLAFNALFFGQSLASGQLATSYGEAGTVPASSPYTVSAVNAATFADDYGVVYAATGLPLTKVTSSTALPASTPSCRPTPARRCCSPIPTASPPRASSSPLPIR